MKCLNVLCLALIVIGALNWGLWGFFQFDLVAWLFGGSVSTTSRIIYSIIGLAGLWSITFFCKCKGMCGCGCGCEGGSCGGSCDCSCCGKGCSCKPGRKK